MEAATQNGAMTVIRLITNNYLQTLCSLSCSCGETELNIALQNPLPSPTRIPLLSVSLHPSFSLLAPSIPDSAFHSRRSASATFLPLHLGLLPSLPFPSRLGLPSFICCNFSSLHTFSCLHPVYLCTGHTSLYLPPLTGVSPPERLTIPSAALLICHPNGGTRGEKQQFAEGEAAAEGQGKVSGLPPSIKFQAVTSLIYAALLAQDQNSF